MDINKLKSCDKSFFSLNDLSKFFSIGRNSLKVSLNRQVKNGKIIRLKKNVYVSPGKIYDIKKIASELYPPCYLSFESALNEYGVLSQIPYALTFATTNKSKRMTLAGQEIEFRQIKKRLFFGYKLEGGLFVAEREKALTDQLYFSSRGLAGLNFKELDLSQVAAKKFLSFVKAYPETTQNLAKELQRYFGKSAITIK